MTVKNETVSRRITILDAAARLIAERGYHAVRVADIAAVAETSTGTVHYYFPGKNDVLIAAMQRAIDRAIERQGDALRKLSGSHQRLLKLVEMQLPQIGPVRDEWAVWMQFWAETAVHAELRPLHRAYYDRWYDTVVRAVERGQRHGEFRTDLDPRSVARQLTALTDGLAIQTLTGVSGVTVSVMRETLVDFVSGLVAG